MRATVSSEPSLEQAAVAGRVKAPLLWPAGSEISWSDDEAHTYLASETEHDQR